MYHNSRTGTASMGFQMCENTCDPLPERTGDMPKESFSKRPFGTLLKENVAESRQSGTVQCKTENAVEFRTAVCYSFLQFSTVKRLCSGSSWQFYIVWLSISYK